MFDSPERLLLGLVTGILFGFLLQKGRVAKFPVIVGQFLLKDWTVVKVMGTAVIVGSVGVHALVASGQANLHVKPFLLGGVLVGGVCFGVGMAVFGYCPGTGVAACGEGKPDAMAGVLGMLAGALAFVVAFPALRPVMNGLGDSGKLTLPEASGTSPWLWVAAMAGSGLAALALHFNKSMADVPRRERVTDPGVRAGSPS
jgi:uncharacterized membrane protein YedE/YeeE